MVYTKSWIWNLDRTVQSDQENLESFIFAVLLASRTVLCAKNRDPCKPRSNLTVLRTMIRPLLTVPYFPLNLNLKKKKKKIYKKKTHTHTHTHIIYKYSSFSLLSCYFCIFAFSVFLSSLVISCFCLLIYST